MIENTHKVPKSQWKKWDEIERSVFNDLFKVMNGDQDLFLHPEAIPHSKKHWKTTAWNAAWMASYNIRYRRKNPDV